jgi:hypothetical protein
MRRALLAPFLATLAACSSGSTNVIHTSVDTSKPVSSLSASDLQTWCSDLDQSIVAAVTPAEIQADLCTTSGLQAGLQGVSGSSPAFDVGACQSAYADCLKQPAPSFNGGPDCATIAKDAPACDATVAAVDQCVSDEIAALDAAAADATMVCTEIGSGTTPSTPATPASCTSLPAGCQPLLGSSSSSSSG